MLSEKPTIAELIARLGQALHELWLSEFAWHSIDVFAPIYDLLCEMIALHGMAFARHGDKWRIVMSDKPAKGPALKDFLVSKAHESRIAGKPLQDHADTDIAALRTSDVVPSPTVVLATSPGKYQALWRVDGFDFERQETTLKQLSIVFGGDRACTDCNRVLRIPGFLNQKYSPAHPVTVEYLSDSVWNPGDFHLDNAALPLRGITRPMQPGKHTHSEQDWVWVLDELAHGMDAVKLTHSLASAAPTNPTLSITPSAPWTWLQPVSGCSKAHPLTT